MSDTRHRTTSSNTTNNNINRTLIRTYCSRCDVLLSEEERPTLNRKEGLTLITKRVDCPDEDSSLDIRRANLCLTVREFNELILKE